MGQGRRLPPTGSIADLHPGQAVDATPQAGRQQVTALDLVRQFGGGLLHNQAIKNQIDVPTFHEIGEGDALSLKFDHAIHRSKE